MWFLYPWTSRLCCPTGKLDEVYSKLVDANPNMMVYKKESIPARFHYQHNSRIMPILLEAKEGWTIMQNRSGTFLCKYSPVWFFKKKQKKQEVCLFY